MSPEPASAVGGRGRLLGRGRSPPPRAQTTTRPPRSTSARRARRLFPPAVRLARFVHPDASPAHRGAEAAPGAARAARGRPVRRGGRNPHQAAARAVVVDLPRPRGRAAERGRFPEARGVERHGVAGRRPRDGRSGGVLSLQNLVWFAKHRRETYERLLYKKTGTRSAWEAVRRGGGQRNVRAGRRVGTARRNARVRRRGGSGGRAFGNDARAAHERRGGVFGPARPRDSLDRARCAFGRRARRAFARLERLECRSRFRV